MCRKCLDLSRERGYTFGILTGDKKENAERLLGHLASLSMPSRRLRKK
jgi:hypothetical protein